VDIQLSKQQKQALEDILEWFKSGKGQFITLGGYAGTGKTTLISFLRKALHQENKTLKVAFCSFTGKATRVLNQKLVESKTLYKGDSVSTIHRLIYKPLVNAKGEITGWERQEHKNFLYGLIVVDEASMLNQDVWKDLLGYGVPIIAVGDHGQLPPIEGKFNLMESPQLVLEEIYRQEQGNPIIRISELARKNGEIPLGIYGRKARKIARTDTETQEFLGELFRGFSDEMLVLVGYNHTRVKLNKAIRSLLEFESEFPESGDRVICLHNNHQKQIFNGMLGTIQKIAKDDPDRFSAEVLLDGEDRNFKGDILASQFGSQSKMNIPPKAEIDLFDFGYALTVHKAQGSQAQKVVLFEERFSKMDDETWCRWLYTGVTRASEELYIIG
jgi:exodeoxyribonuclease-5